jgi:hypothetical protein
MEVMVFLSFYVLGLFLGVLPITGECCAALSVGETPTPPKLD